MNGGPFPELDEASVAQLQTAMADGRLAAQVLVEMFLARIEALDQNGPQFHAILEINPQAQDIAALIPRTRAVSGLARRAASRYCPSQTATADNASHHVPGLPVGASSRSTGMPNMVKPSCGSCLVFRPGHGFSLRVNPVDCDCQK
jgi:hypothetical protein